MVSLTIYLSNKLMYILNDGQNVLYIEDCSRHRLLICVKFIEDKVLHL